MSALVYRRRPSGLHAARAPVAIAYCASLAVVALAASHPVVLAADLVAVLLAGARARVGRALVAGLRWWLPVALVSLLVNALVVRSGLTVILRGPTVPGFGELDVTLEALVQGAVIALRVVTVVAAAGLYALAVDPDELLRGMRRLSSRSALAATLAVRLAPTLGRDVARLTDARRALRGGELGAGDRVLVLRAAITGALERATDVAATLELRGYVAGGRPARRRLPWSRHDLSVAAAALGLAAVATGLAVGRLAPFTAYPAIHGASAATAAPLGLILVTVAVAPLLSRRGVVT